MSDDNIIKNTPANAGQAEEAQEAAEEIASERVFDITPDLNISPISEDDETKNSTDAKPDQFTGTDIIPPPAPTSVIPPAPTTVAPAGPATEQPRSETTYQRPVPAPQNIPTETSSLASPVFPPRSGPASPPVKTIQSQSPAPSVRTEQPTSRAESLQAAIASSIAAKSEPTKNIAATAEQNRPLTVDPTIKPLRTYESDFAEAMSRKHISSATIAIAEKKKQDAETKPPQIEKQTKLPVIDPIKVVQRVEPRAEPKREYYKVAETPKPFTPPPAPPEPVKAPPAIQPDNSENEMRKAREVLLTATAEPIANPPQEKAPSHGIRNFILLISSIILVGGGIMAAYYLYSQSSLSPLLTPSPTPSVAAISIQVSAPLITADSQSIVPIDGITPGAIISKIRSAADMTVSNGQILEIVPTKLIKGIPTRVPAPDMAGTMGLGLPDILERSLADSWMLGLYAGQSGQKSLFVIATNDFFQNAFAGTLQWEKDMVSDLAPYLTPENPESQPNFSLRGQFVDRIIGNRDVREYVAEDGHVIFLYSFISNDKLALAGSEEALSEIISRLEKQVYVR